MPTPVKRPTSQFYWIRKKVPLRYRKWVGRKEVWKSLETTDRRTAVARCTAASAAFEAEWARLAAGCSNPAAGVESTPLTHQDLHALRGAAHVRVRDAHLANPPVGFAAVGLRAALDESDPEAVDQAVRTFLAAEGVEATDAEVARFAPMFIAARRAGYADVARAAGGDYSENPELAKLPPRTTPKLDLLKAFEEYVEKGGLKGGKDGPTAKRWRPKIRDFCKWLGHRDLARMTNEDGYRWADHLVDQGYNRKSVRLVWIASLSATAGFMVERRKPGAQNPFRGIVVRDAVDTNAEAKPPRQKGFTQAEAKKILTATVATPSSLISPEKRAARRWLPWLCAYSGARVNEITSLFPADITQDEVSGVWCMVIKPSLEKTSNWRTVPIHSHVIEQGFLEYVEERRRLGKPLFYDPARGRGGKIANPQYKKTAERIADWVRSLDIKGVQPNHGWRHLFKSVARHVHMNSDVEGFIVGHRPKDANAGHDYGDRWVTTMSAEVEKYPRFDIPALRQPSAPNKRRHRTNFDATVAKPQMNRRAARARRSPQQITADKADRTARRTAS
uniref:DUF6538 domain-containing protein n=1 Tax=Bradyrhizobium diazoefficiens TaxID=1355477 RepID=A0A810B1K8_9BRAD|nr:hypothetical protein XF8B_03190 [Bradyrhizobium diazoefficiens]